jgi:hypothetical protein
MKHIQLFEDFVNEGLFDFLKSDTIDYSKSYQEEKDKKGFRKRPRNKKNDIIPDPQKPYYDVQEKEEDEEEEKPYYKIVKQR